MLNITPTSIFPLKYPKGDTAVPEKGAMAVPVDLDWSKSTSYSVSLLVVQEQKFFGSLRCIWIDASANTHPITVAVNGTEQVFTVAAGSANYYAVVNLNIPLVSLTIGAGEATLTRVIFLNFVPEISMAGQVSIAGTVTVSGNVSVNNFPALQKVDVTDVGGSAINIGQALMAKSLPVVIASDQSAIPASQSGAWAVSVSNFPATQPVSGTVSASQSGAWNVGITGTPSFNLTQVGGAAIALGQTTMAKSVPVVVASDQAAFPIHHIATGLGASIVTGTTAVSFTSPGQTRLLAIQIVSFGAVLAAGSVQLIFKDGSGAFIFVLNIPVATATATQPFTVAENESLYIPLNNVAGNGQLTLSANLTSGSFIVSGTVM